MKLWILLSYMRILACLEQPAASVTQNRTHRFRCRSGSRWSAGGSEVWSGSESLCEDGRFYPSDPRLWRQRVLVLLLKTNSTRKKNRRRRKWTGSRNLSLLKSNSQKLALTRVKIKWVTDTWNIVLSGLNSIESLEFCGNNRHFKVKFWTDTFAGTTNTNVWLLTLMRTNSLLTR